MSSPSGGKDLQDLLLKVLRVRYLMYVFPISCIVILNLLTSFSGHFSLGA